MAVVLFGGLSFIGAPVMAAGSSSVTLKVVTFLPKNDRHLDYFWKFVDRVQKQSKGKIKILVVGGPEAVPSFEQIQATRTGVVDLVATVGAYYTGDLAEAWAFQYGNITPLQERKVGFYDFIDKIHQEKLNIKYLGRFSFPGQFYFFSNVPLRKMADFKGKRIRVSSGYEPFVKALGASTMSTKFSEVYSVMERGVVDAFGWPIPGPLSYGWVEVFKYVILPGWYEMNTVMNMNLDSWNKLSSDNKKIIMDNTLWMEKEIVPYYTELVKKNLKIMIEEKGIKAITIAEPEKFVKLAMDSAWEMVRKKSPENGANIERMIRK